MSLKVDLLVSRLDNNVQLPEYAHEGDSGCDLRASEDCVVEHGKVTMVSTGITATTKPIGIALPKSRVPSFIWKLILRVLLPIFEDLFSFEVQLRPRSGLAKNHGIIIVNTPATIDVAYRGEWKVLLTKLTPGSTTIKKGDRIAQAVVAPVLNSTHVFVRSVSSLSVTSRGSGGFGSTGIH